MKARGRKFSLIVVAVAALLGLSQMAHASSLWFVDGAHGNDGNNCRTPQTACKTIGHAISLASSGDSIFVAGATYRENLTINFSLNVIGAGAATTIVDGGDRNTVVTITNSNTHFNLSMVTIRGGHSINGGGINNAGTTTVSNSLVTENGSTRNGGGIYSGGVLTINNSTISGNGSTEEGGGIFSWGTLTINSSTISGNSVYVYCDGGCITWGGGIFSSGTLIINNSTITGNSAQCTRGPVGRCQPIWGGGILINPSGTLTINNSTVSGNSAVNGGGGVYSRVESATIQNSILSNNTGGNCGGTITSNGHNLSGDGTCSFHNSGDLNNTNPMLGPLQNNGGPTQTQALLDGSPAIDAGNPGGCTDGNGHLLTTDQRGMPRPDPEDTGGCDMGAYERQSD